jgi:glycosyltransferase involved in cell wall biosynthesis
MLIGRRNIGAVPDGPDYFLRHPSLFLERRYRLRIAEVSPPWERVPPPAYGGIEAVVGSLTEHLVRRGHDVTLYATGDSITAGRLRAICDVPLRQLGVKHSLPYELAHVGSLLADANDFEVIHNHCGSLLMAFSRTVATPILTTIHGPMESESRIIWDTYHGFHNSISRSARNGFPSRGYLGVVYNGIDVDSYPFHTTKDDYLLFLGRICAEKGTHHAIDVARAVGRRLVIAGKVDRADVDYYEREIAPRIDGSHVNYYGEADGQQKRELFARARCLLHPVTWSEPFGLVMVEAMACGTPVIGFRRGSIPEVISHEETGFVVDTVDQMVSAVERVGGIDPQRCRERVIRLFSDERMTTEYERLFGRVVSAGGNVATLA